MTNPSPTLWGQTPTTAELEANYALTASLDPGFAASDRKWWETRTLSQLQSQRGYAYNLSNEEMYAKANYYIDLMLEG